MPSPAFFNSSSSSRRRGLSILLRTINKTLYVCLLVLVNILALVAKRTLTALSSSSLTENDVA